MRNDFKRLQSMGSDVVFLNNHLKVSEYFLPSEGIVDAICLIYVNESFFVRSWQIPNITYNEGPCFDWEKSCVLCSLHRDGVIQVAIFLILEYDDDKVCLMKCLKHATIKSMFDLVSVFEEFNVANHYRLCLASAPHFEVLARPHSKEESTYYQIVPS